MNSATSITQLSMDETKEQFLLEVLTAVENIRYGYVQITIQNGKVVQIDKTEKIRFSECSPNSKGGGTRY